jgi:hypothetical protein
LRDGGVHRVIGGGDEAIGGEGGKRAESEEENGEKRAEIHREGGGTFNDGMRGAESFGKIER